MTPTRRTVAVVFACLMVVTYVLALSPALSLTLRDLVYR